MSELPAILGGEPLFPLGPPLWPPLWPEVKSALDEAYKTGAWGQYHGPNVSELESELAAQFSVTHALTCSSGTLAVEVALRAAGVGPGDEVILAAYDYEANFLNVHAIGAKPVLIDTDPRTGQFDPTHLNAAQSNLTKAILCSHLHGGLVAMPTVMVWANASGVMVVEDAAQCPGATIEGKPAGSWGHIGILSFGGSKLLSAGRGGAIVTSDERLLQRAKLFLSRGVQQWAELSELQACVLRPQLERLAERTETRLQRVNRLLKALEVAKGLTPFLTQNEIAHSAFYKLGFQFDESEFGLMREHFCRVLRAEGVAFDPGFSALHRSRAPSRFRAVGELPNASKLHDSCVILHHPVLLEREELIDRVAAAVLRTYRNAEAISRSLQ